MIPTFQIGGLGLRRGSVSGGVVSPFPIVEEVTATPGWDTAVTSKALTMNSTVNAGDLLIWIGGISDGSGAATITPPTGWATALISNGTTRRLYAIYKVADGSEGGVAQNLVTSAVCRGVGVCYRIRTGTYTGTPEAANSTPGAGVAPCPSLTPSWGADDMLAIGCVMGTPGTVTVSAYPLADNQRLGSSGINSPLICASCSDEVSSSPVSPGSFTLSAYATIRTGTIAVRGI